MKIRVTPEDLQQGRRCSSCLCPVARALRRVCHEQHNINVGRKEALIDNCVLLPLPQVACEFILNYDMGKDYARRAEPFEFELEIPERYLGKGAMV